MSAPVATQKLTTEPLRWVRVDAYHFLSECERFSIAKVLVNGAPRYEAWHKSKQIGHVQLEADSTQRERDETVGALKALCEAAA